jgi:membrane associated rhomboid family serine protease
VGQLCRDCATPEAGARVITSRQLGTGTLRESAPVTFGLIVACVAAFVGSFVLPLGTLFAQINPLVAQGEVWRLVSAAFLHSTGSFLHIAFNMYALYAFGPGLERQVRGPAFLGLYLGSAIAGGAAFYVVDVLDGTASGTAVGASGAIFGLFGATLVTAWSGRRTPAGRAFLRQLLTLLAINLALPLFLPRIAWQAHVGGLVAGIVIAGLWSLVGSGRNREAARTAAGAVVGLAALALVLVL